MSNITVDAKQVLNMFAELDSRRQKAVHRTTLRQSGNILARQARVNLKSVVKSKTNARSAKTGKTMNSGVKVKVDRDATRATIHIMGDFRLKWFEIGTNIRKTKQGYDRGQMTATHFFKSAKEQTEARIFSNIDESLKKSIIKVYQKYKS